MKSWLSPYQRNARNANHTFFKVISPWNEKFFCSHENFRSTWKLRPTRESKMSFRSTWVSFPLDHLSAPRALTVDQNGFQTNLKLRPVWVCSCEGTLSLSKIFAYCLRCWSDGDLIYSSCLPAWGLSKEFICWLWEHFEALLGISMKPTAPAWEISLS